MNFVSRTITGAVLIILGAILIAVSFFTSLIILIYGIPLFIVGFFVLFNKNEDEIEEVKMKGGRK